MKGYLKRQPDNGLAAHELTQVVTRIGGDNDNDIVIKTTSNEQTHALIEYSNEDQCYVLTDQESTSGSFRNDVLVIAPAKLKDGDVIRFGKTEETFQFYTVSDSGEEELVPEKKQTPFKLENSQLDLLEKDVKSTAQQIIERYEIESFDVKEALENLVRDVAKKTDEIKKQISSSQEAYETALDDATRSEKEQKKLLEKVIEEKDEVIKQRDHKILLLQDAEAANELVVQKLEEDLKEANRNKKELQEGEGDSALDKMHTKNKKLKQDLKEANKEIQELEEDIKESIKKTEELEKNLQEANKRIEEFQQENGPGKENEQNKELEQDFQKANKKIEKLEQSLGEANKMITELQRQQQQNSDGEHEQIKKLKRELKEAREKIEERPGEFKEQEDSEDNVNLAALNQQLKLEIDRLKEYTEKLEQQQILSKNQNNEELTEALTNLEVIRRDNKALSEKIDTLEKDNQTLIERQNEEREKSATEHSKLINQFDGVSSLYTAEKERLEQDISRIQSELDKQLEINKELPILQSRISSQQEENYLRKVCLEKERADAAIVMDQNQDLLQKNEAFKRELAETDKQLNMSEDLRERINRDLHDTTMRLQEAEASMQDAISGLKVKLNGLNSSSATDQGPPVSNRESDAEAAMKTTENMLKSTTPRTARRPYVAPDVKPEEMKQNSFENLCLHIAEMEKSIQLLHQKKIEDVVKPTISNPTASNLRNIDPESNDAKAEVVESGSGTSEAEIAIEINEEDDVKKISVNDKKSEKENENDMRKQVQELETKLESYSAENKNFQEQIESLKSTINDMRTNPPSTTVSQKLYTTSPDVSKLLTLLTEENKRYKDAEKKQGLPGITTSTAQPATTQKKLSVTPSMDKPTKSSNDDKLEKSTEVPKKKKQKELLSIDNKDALVQKPKTRSPCSSDEGERKSWNSDGLPMLSNSTSRVNSDKKKKVIAHEKLSPYEC